MVVDRYVGLKDTTDFSSGFFSSDKTTWRIFCVPIMNFIGRGVLILTIFTTLRVYCQEQIGNDRLYDLRDSKNLYMKFLQRFNKNYYSMDEYMRHFSIFKNTLAKVNQINNGGAQKVQVNFDADLMEGEEDYNRERKEQERKRDPELVMMLRTKPRKTYGNRYLDLIPQNIVLS